MAMLAGMQLNLLTALKDGPRTAAKIAGAAGVSAGKLGPLLHALVVGESLSPLAARVFRDPPRRCRGIQKRNPTGRDGPYMCSAVGALGEGHCSTGADHRSIRGSSCGGGMTDYLLRGVGGQIVWPSAFTASI
jgi:hypothetical protein